MNCPHCGTVNSEDEHRCLHCGRHFAAPLAQPRSSAVPAPVPAPPRLVALPKKEPVLLRVPRQQTLFYASPADARTLRPPAPGAGQAPPQKRGARRARDPNQKTFSFPAPLESGAKSTPKRVVQCQAQPAPIRSRVAAASLDLSLVLAAMGLFAGIFRIWAGGLVFSRTAAVISLAVLASVLLFYKLLACLLSDGSPGTRLAGLRLLHFDGRAPDRRQRLTRLAASCLSLLPIGIGFLWALVDEEHLTFHDHISETFLTLSVPAR